MLANSKKTNSARTRKDTHIKLHEDGLLGNYLLSDKKTSMRSRMVHLQPEPVRITLSGMRDTNKHHEIKCTYNK